MKKYLHVLSKNKALKGVTFYYGMLPFDENNTKPINCKDLNEIFNKEDCVYFIELSSFVFKNCPKIVNNKVVGDMSDLEYEELLESLKGGVTF